jgi:uncharacterized protein
VIVVLDTNVLVSGLVRSNPASAVVRVWDAWRCGRFELAVSRYLLDEFERTIAQPYFASRIGAERRAAVLDLLRAEAHLVSVTATVRNVATHPEDDLVLALAVSARADYLVTGDAKLQAIRAYKDVRIISAREFSDATGD